MAPARVAQRTVDTEFTVTANPSPASPGTREEMLTAPGFGAHFTDHMVQGDWTPAQGWHRARVVPFGPLSLHPAAAVLHHGQEIFEGLKVYRGPDGRLRSFRMQAHEARLAASAARMAMPQLPCGLFGEAVRRLVGIDEAWVPARPDASLYVRPYVVAIEPSPGVRPPGHGWRKPAA